jgi:hypothetical protein
VGVHVLSAVTGLCQFILGLSQGVIDKDWVTSLPGDANLFGVAMGLLIAGIYSLRAFANHYRYRFLVVAALTLVMQLASSHLLSVFFIGMFLYLELASSTDRVPLRLKRALQLIFVLMCGYLSMDFLTWGGGQGSVSQQLYAYATGGVINNAKWVVAAQRSTAPGSGGRLVRLEGAYRFRENSGARLGLGLGPGTVNFSAFEGTDLRSRAKDFDQFLRGWKGIGHDPYFAIDLVTWWLEWGPLATLAFLLALMLGTGVMVFQRQTFEFFVLGFALIQSGVHDYTFGPLLGPLVVFAILLASIRLKTGFGMGRVNPAVNFRVSDAHWASWAKLWCRLSLSRKHYCGLVSHGTSKIQLNSTF